MPKSESRPEQSRAIPDAPSSPADPTADRVPPRRRGGQELPDSVQDRPEQNAGYDAVVHAQDESADLAIPDTRRAEVDVSEDDPRLKTAEIDAQAERDVVAEVRRRERINR